jgi:hypothetical protein
MPQIPSDRLLKLVDDIKIKATITITDEIAKLKLKGVSPTANAVDTVFLQQRSFISNPAPNNTPNEPSSNQTTNESSSKKRWFNFRENSREEKQKERQERVDNLVTLLSKIIKMAENPEEELKVPKNQTLVRKDARIREEISSLVEQYAKNHNEPHAQRIKNSIDTVMSNYVAEKS